MKKHTYDPAQAAQLFPAEGWRKPTASDGSGVGCVEVNMERALSHGLVGLRDSTQRHAGTFVFDETEWNAFLDGASRGEFTWPVA